MPRQQNAVDGRQGVGDRRLPRAGGGTGEHQHGAGGGAEHGFQVGEQPDVAGAKVMGALVLHRQVHRLPDGFGNIGRAGDEQVIDAGAHGASLIGGPVWRRREFVQSENRLRCEREKLQIFISVIV